MRCLAVPEHVIVRLCLGAFQLAGNLTVPPRFVLLMGLL